MEREEFVREAAAEELLREAQKRRFIYNDLEEILENGFLTHSLTFEGKAVTFRSLLPPDVVRLQARTSRMRGTLEALRWSLSASVWIVDGFEVPIDPTQNGPYHVYQNWMRDLPRSAVEALSVVIVSFHNRVRRATKLTESFCYEPYGRGLWRLQGRSVKGLKDSSVVRRLWVAHMLSEDSTIEQDRTWSHTQAIVSSMTSKGGKQLREALKKADGAEETRRQGVIEAAVNWVIHGDPTEQKPLTILVGGQEMEIPKIHSAQTLEDLETEMRRVFTGENDYHDHLVQQYQEGIKAKVEKQRKFREDAIAEARRRYDEREEDGTPPLVGYTRGQLEELRPDISTTRTTANIPESAQASYMYQRYIEPNLTPGVLTPGLKVTDSDRPDLEKSSKEEPFGGGSSREPTLQEKIARRKPSLKGD